MKAFKESGHPLKFPSLMGSKPRGLVVNFDGENNSKLVYFR